MEVNKFNESMKKEWIYIAVLSVIGMLIGPSITINAMGGGFGPFMLGIWAGLGVGGNIWVTIQYTLKSGFRFGAVIGLFVAGAIVTAGIFTGPIIPGVRIMKKRKEVEEFERIVDEEIEALQLMEDYFRYTLAMEKGGYSKDFATLTAEGGELFNNSYARSVKEKGEAAAQAHLRESVVQIAANGEIIRKSA